MQTIKARFDGRIFIPLQAVNLKKSTDVLLSVQEEVDKEKILNQKRKELRKYSQDRFPDIEVDEELIELVGILPRSTPQQDREDYIAHLERKYLK